MRSLVRFSCFDWYGRVRYASVGNDVVSVHSMCCILRRFRIHGSGLTGSCASRFCVEGSIDEFSIDMFVLDWLVDGSS